ncbi:sigma factor-like helix-turn-helix DNA-binding protein [Geosporobacter subterraneus]|uniref:sigma factor-like helix-turn-helix DNA-binding protein n=1 Tax=Geosporobacter subterraneus TaxID=390806 RepID=UPI000DA5FF86|nr:sigma factor-like helix-turn-helix DNA-binding protein [Geosporobacter subterraneus]
MNCIENYKDLCTDIEVQQCIVDDIEKELKQLEQLMLNGPKDITGIDYSREPGGQAIYISMDRILDRIQRIERRLKVEREILEQKKQIKVSIDEKIQQLSGLDAKVVRMRDIDKLTLREIADILGYSEIWIKKVSSRNKSIL